MTAFRVATTFDKRNRLRSRGDHCWVMPRPQALGGSNLHGIAIAIASVRERRMTL